MIHSIILLAILIGIAHAASSQYNFTNAGATGGYGPTQEQINTAYAGTGLENSVTIETQGRQEWMVPTDGEYLIQAWGAQGGSGGSSKAGGKGANVSGRFLFQSGHKLYIVVGQKGHDSASGGGGGGSFVWDDTCTGIPRLIAAGGGGASWDGDEGGPGNSGPRAGAGAFSAPWDGQGGMSGEGFDGSGGGGWSSSGMGEYGGASKGGEGFGYGGGSFGGGGASPDAGGGGGGGGYTGGSAGAQNGKGGGGDSSFNSGAEQVNQAGVNAGHGKVTITVV